MNNSEKRLVDEISALRDEIRGLQDKEKEQRPLLDRLKSVLSTVKKLAAEGAEDPAAGIEAMVQLVINECECDPVEAYHFLGLEAPAELVEQVRAA